jgi:hypothetical protein
MDDSLKALLLLVDDMLRGCAL